MGEGEPLMDSNGAEPKTAERILDTAEELVQMRGFNGFSYAHLAERLNVTKPSLHYHFATKALLGEELILRYTQRFTEALARIDASGADAPGRLADYVGLYRDVINAHRICLCGMLAAEYQTLPEPMRDAVVRFFDVNEAWLESVLDEGSAAGSIQLVGGSARGTARGVLSGLEGAMLMTRPYGDAQRFQDAADRILAGLYAPSVRTPRQDP